MKNHKVKMYCTVLYLKSDVCHKKRIYYSTPIKCCPEWEVEHTHYIEGYITNSDVEYLVVLNPPENELGEKIYDMVRKRDGEQRIRDEVMKYIVEEELE